MARLNQYRDGATTVRAAKITAVEPFVPQRGALTLMLEGGKRTNVNKDWAALSSPVVGGYFVVFDSNTAGFMTADDFAARFTAVEN